MRLVSRARIKPGKFEEVMGKSNEELDKQYDSFLRVTSKQVEKHLARPASRTELSLTSADLKPAAFDVIGKCVNLNWLDLSANTITAADLMKLKGCQRLHQLFLTQCILTCDANDVGERTNRAVGIKRNRER